MKVTPFRISAGAPPSEGESLQDTVKHLEEEARMVLPGIQAIFGFQLVAVFNQRFTDLSGTDQAVHLSALVASALAIILVLTPAAYHRQVEPRRISEYFCAFGSRLLSLSLLPLSLGMSLDVYVIGKLTLQNQAAALAGGIAMLCLSLAAWYGFPYWKMWQWKGRP